MPSVIGTSTSAIPAANTSVSGSRRHLRAFTADARYAGNRNTMQHGLKSATAPAKNAARIEPVVRSPPITAPPLFREAPRIGPLEGASSEHLGDRRGKGRGPSPLQGQSDTAAPPGLRERRAALGRRA